MCALSISSWCKLILSALWKLNNARQCGKHINLKHILNLTSGSRDHHHGGNTWKKMPLSWAARIRSLMVSLWICMQFPQIKYVQIHFYLSKYHKMLALTSAWKQFFLKEKRLLCMILNPKRDQRFFKRKCCMDFGKFFFLMSTKVQKHSHIAFSKSTQAALDNPPVREINEHPRKRTIQYQNCIVCKIIIIIKYCVGVHINQEMAWCFFLPLLVGLAFTTHPLYSNPGVKLYNDHLNICHFLKKKQTKIFWFLEQMRRKTYCSDTSSLFSKKIGGKWYLQPEVNPVSFLLFCASFHPLSSLLPFTFTVHAILQICFESCS